MKSNQHRLKEFFFLHSKSKNFHNQTFGSPSYFMDDISNNSYTSRKCVSMSMSNPTSPKRPQPILDAQLIGDDFFRMLVARDSTDHMYDRSKFSNLQHFSNSCILNSKKKLSSQIQTTVFNELVCVFRDLVFRQRLNESNSQLTSNPKI